MFNKTNYSVPEDILAQATVEIANAQQAQLLNKPTGDKLCDPWELTDETKGTVWEKILSTIPEPIGEARLIKLSTKQCYQKHTDGNQKRYTLNINGSDSYLVDLTTLKMHEFVHDGCWYTYDASTPHTAGNFGTTDRWQVIIIQLNPR